ncbi:MAG: hypothetical protein R3Y58_11965 [Eubacteriales bacterium]
MTNTVGRLITFIDKEVAKLIIEKYGYEEMEAISLFLKSETYEMLVDTELELYRCSPHILFDMWECEKITKNPRKSQYIRGN